MVRVVLYNSQHVVEFGALDEYGALPVLNPAATNLNQAFVLRRLDGDLPRSNLLRELGLWSDHKNRSP
jgi:hypothetical protein